MNNYFRWYVGTSSIYDEGWSKVAQVLQEARERFEKEENDSDSDSDDEEDY